MKKYFYSDGFREFGPFTTADLMSKKMRADYQVRAEDETTLVPGHQHPDLKFLFESKPEFQKQKVRQQKTDTIVKPKSFIKENYVLVGILFWFVLRLARVPLSSNFISFKTATIVRTALGIGIGFLPLIFALSVRDRSKKVIAIVIAAAIALWQIHDSINYAVTIFERTR
ncbi:hypothetical protein [Nonlabens ponticola]|uniref:DUF4339 domain-containing protein n=1 Tax=Nonlabens ponticola TaxID=2496866 RepID=A0A3S9MZQ0_9FLAO|nr:hypothetical protein [Nonlabens ponticola]AZQ44614.1 hypothetical protein EJ995_10315 [Nonlabens ponticola]